MFRFLSKIFAISIGLFWATGAYAQYVTLHTWYSVERGDHFTTTLPAWSGEIGARKASGYQLVRVEGSLLSPDYPQPADTLPVYSFYSDVRKDNFLSSNPVWTGSENRDGYRRVRLEGYIYDKPKANTVPLNSLWSDRRKDNYNTTDPRLALEFRAGGNRTETVRDGGYRVFRVEGYMLPPPRIDDIKQLAHIANLAKIGFGEWRPLQPRERGTRPDDPVQRGAVRFKSRMVIVPVEFADAQFGPGDFARYGKFASASDNLSLERGINGISRGKFSWQASLTPVVRDPLTMAQARSEVFDEAWKAVERRTERIDGRDVTWSPELFERRNGFPLSVYDLDGDGPEFDEVHPLTRVLKLADRFIRFNTYDTNGDGRVEKSELVVLRFGADPGNGGQFRGSSGDYNGDGKTVAIPVLLVAKDTTRTGIMHELLHVWGGTDVYGPGFSMNFRNTVMSGMSGDDTAWELDPWHLQKFGWVRPRFVPIGLVSRRAGGSEVMLAAGRDVNGQEAARPIIFYDPQRGLREYFIAQYRSQFPRCSGSAACLNFKDNGAPDTGFAIWHVRTKASGGLEDIFKRDDRDDRVAWPSGTGDNGHLFYLGVINPEDGKIGDTKYLKPGNSQIAPRWWDGTDTGLRLRAGLVSETSTVAVLQWRDVSTPFTPRLDILRLAGFPAEEYPVANAGQTVAVDGVFGSDRTGFGARLVAESGGEVITRIISWSPGRILFEIPPSVRPGRYKVVVGASAAAPGADFLSNGLKLQIPMTAMASVDLPRDFDRMVTVPGIVPGLLENIDLTARRLPQITAFQGAPIAPHSYGKLSLNNQVVPRQNIAPDRQIATPGILQPNIPKPASGNNAKICFTQVQGKIAWDYKGSKKWSKANIDRLCRGAENSREPAICFQRAMHERKDGKQWKWNDAIDLCEASRNASATIRCYDQQTQKGRSLRQAIKTCGK